MIRFLHTADWQIGMTRHFLQGEAQSRYTEARLDAIRRCGAVAREQGCAFVVVGGDVFESNHLGRQVVARSLEAMGELGVDVYLVPGNHDPLNEGSIWTSPRFADRPASVHLLDTPVELTIGDDVVELVPAPWRTKRPLSDTVDATLADLPSPRGFRVVIGHGAVDVLSPDANDPAVIRLAPLEAAIDAGDLHYVALGDRHSVTDVGTTGRVRYSGTPLVTDYDEGAPNRALVVDLEPGRASVTEHEVGDWRFLLQRFDFADPADVGALTAWLTDQPDKSRTVVKLTLVGTLSLAGKAALDDALERFADLFAAIEVWQRHSDLVVLPDESDLDGLGLAGFAAEALGDLRAAAPTDDDAQDALALLYRLAVTR